MVRFSGSLHFVTTGAVRHAEEGNGESPYKGTEENVTLLSLAELLRRAIKVEPLGKSPLHWLLWVLWITPIAGGGRNLSSMCESPNQRTVAEI